MANPMKVGGVIGCLVDIEPAGQVVDLSVAGRAVLVALLGGEGGLKRLAVGDDPDVPAIDVGLTLAVVERVALHCDLLTFDEGASVDEVRTAAYAGGGHLALVLGERELDWRNRADRASYVVQEPRVW
jgi:hypothetical protein